MSTFTTPFSSTVKYVHLLCLQLILEKKNQVREKFWNFVIVKFCLKYVFIANIVE